MNYSSDSNSPPPSPPPSSSSARNIFNSHKMSAEESATCYSPTTQPKAATKSSQDSSPGGMELLIPVVNKLQEIFERTGAKKFQIDLPQIVVLGTQSAGKSSVLESFVGQPFLPRGTGLVTRCPIILQLIYSPGVTPWFEFQHKPGEKFTNVEQVTKEIVSQTNVLAGPDKGITREAITVTVHSPDVLTLTVVDLPGLVKVPVGDQPQDIEAQVNELVMDYISQKNAIILAVTPANADVATSDSIKLAKQVDPLQERTLVVMTKLDLAPSNLGDLLTGKLVANKLGVVGVVNRSQEDIDGNKSIQDVVRDEALFLKKNYGTIASQNGSPYLAQRLNQILKKHIDACCPSLEMRVRELIKGASDALDALGTDGDLDDDTGKRLTLVTIIDKFAKAYKAQIGGQGRAEITGLELTGGAAIDTIFFSDLKKQLEDIDVLGNISDQEILNALRNSAPVATRMGTPEATLEYIVRKEIVKLKPVASHTANLVHQEMIKMIKKCLAENKRFPKVNQEISSIVGELLNEKMDETRHLLEVYIDIQSDTGLTSNAAYQKLFTELMTPVDSVAIRELPLKGCQSSNDERLMGELRQLVVAAFNIVKLQVQDQIPKSILFALVYKTVDEVGIALNMALNLPDKINELIREPEEIHEQRVALKSDLEEYERAAKVLADVRSGSFAG